jgi:hypothetical protein
MTDERRWDLPGADTDEADPADGPRRERDPRDPSDGPAPDSDTEKDPNPLMREGPDAPDAADIEDPDEQL